MGPFSLSLSLVCDIFQINSIEPNLQTSQELGLELAKCQRLKVAEWQSGKVPQNQKCPKIKSAPKSSAPKSKVPQNQVPKNQKRPKIKSVPKKISTKNKFQPKTNVNQKQIST